MRDSFCDWCVKCAKYLAFGTPDESAIMYSNDIFNLIFYINILTIIYIYI